MESICNETIFELLGSQMQDVNFMFYGTMKKDNIELEYISFKDNEDDKFFINIIKNFDDLLKHIDDNNPYLVYVYFHSWKDKLINILKKVYKKNEVSLLLPFKTNVGTKFYKLEFRKVKNRKHEYILYLFEENELGNTQLKLLELSYVDNLTKLHNKSYLKNILENSEKCKNKYITMIDLNKFKLINDSFGHYFGDDLLVYYSHLLKTISNNRMYKNNEIELFRLNGDEFIILSDFKSVAEISNYLSHLEELCSNITIDGKEIKLTFSFGIYKIKSNENYEAILDNVSTYMMNNKRGTKYENRSA